MSFNKSTRNRNPQKQAAKQGRYKNQDKNRWRKVAVWLIPLIFFIPFTVAFGAHGALFIWTSVLASIVFLGYAVFLLEWYVWREGLARERLLGSFGVLCAVAFGVGIVWQAGLPRLPAERAKSPSESSAAPITESTPKAPASPTPTAITEERILLDVKPEYLLGFFKKYTTVQAQELVKPYIGKWVKLSGEVRDVEPDLIFGNLPDEGPTVMIRTKASPRTFGAFCEFDEERWRVRAKLLQPGEQITFFGRIRRITDWSLSLEKCEFVE